MDPKTLPDLRGTAKVVEQSIGSREAELEWREDTGREIDQGHTDRIGYEKEFLDSLDKAISEHPENKPSDIRVEIATDLCPVLCDLAVGSDVDTNSPKFQMVAAALESAVPAMLRKAYPFWEKESVHGFQFHSLGRTRRVRPSSLASPV